MTWFGIIKGLTPYEKRRNRTLITPLTDEWGRPLFGQRTGGAFSRKEWKENIKTRPTNYNKINNIAVLLNRHNIPINRQSILEELVDFPTNDDNEAIEFVLREMQQ